MLCKAQLNNCIDWICWRYINIIYYYYYYPDTSPVILWQSSSGDLEEEGSSPGGSSDSSRSGTEAEDGDNREQKDGGKDGETAKKVEPMASMGVIRT